MSTAYLEWLHLVFQVASPNRCEVEFGAKHSTCIIGIPKFQNHITIFVVSRGPQRPLPQYNMYICNLIRNRTVELGHCFQLHYKSIANLECVTPLYVNNINTNQYRNCKPKMTFVWLITCKENRRFLLWWMNAKIKPQDEVNTLTQTVIIIHNFCQVKIWLWIILFMFAAKTRSNVGYFLYS